LTVGSEREAGVNAFETVLAEIVPLLGGATVQDLDADDIDYLSRATGVEPEFIELAKKAVGLASTSGIPAEAFYGLGRRGHPLDLGQLAALDSTTLRDSLRESIGARSIPESFAPHVEESVRKLRRTGDRTVRVTARLRDATTGLPLSHALVTAVDLDDPDGGPLGTALADARGVVRLQYSAQPGSPGHRIRLTPAATVDDPHRLPGTARLQPAAVTVTAAAEAMPATEPGPRPGVLRFATGLPGAPPAPLSPPPAVVTSPEAGPDEVHAGPNVPPRPAEPPRVGEPPPPVPTLDIAPQPGAGPVTVTVGTAERTVGASGVEVPEDLASYLYASGLTTLSSLRHMTVGLHGRDDLPTTVSRDAVRAVESHADLARIMPDASTRAALIDLGYTGVGSIAAVPSTQFVRAAGDLLGDFTAARLHHTAVAQTRFLDNILSSELTNPATSPENAGDTPQPSGNHGEGAAGNTGAGAGAEPADTPAEGRPSGGQAGASTVPVRCTCNECSSALGPLAYLADLLKYAVDHLRAETAPVDAAALQGCCHQPFADLPVSCAAADQRVRTLRLVAESLRQYLRSAPPTTARGKELAKSESDYRVAAYEALLAQLGTSYEEPPIRGPQRAALAERLGILLTTPAPPEGDEISRLCLALSPSATPSGRTELTEQALEALFGLPDTTRDPLSGGAKSEDPNGDIRRWRFRGASWSRSTSPDGSVFVTVTSVAGSGEIVAEVFRDRGCTQRVASGRADGPAAALTLVPAQGSGLYGSLEVVHTADIPPEAPVEIVVVPRFTAWRLARLRALWRAQDTEGRPYAGPVVDPDVVPLESLVSPTSGAAAGLWQQRSDALVERVEHVRQLIGDLSAPPGLTQFGGMIEDTFGIASNAVRDLARRRDEGEDLTDELAELALTEHGLDLLARVRTLIVAGEQVEEKDWAGVTDVCVRAWKHSRIAEWRTEESAKQVTLSPDHFRTPETAGNPAPPGSRWRVDPTALGEWYEVLTARAGDVTTAVAAVGEAVDAAERQVLPRLRDALVQATQPDGDTAASGTALQERAEALSRQLFVDVQTSDCDCTTRASHAIEALHTMLLAARGDRFLATPKLRLEAPQFDAEWKWIGSYASWRAAMFVHLWPENLLLPSLQNPQTPAYSALLTQFNSRPATPEAAKAAAGRYARYLEDVCSLELACSTSAVTTIPGGGYSCKQFLFARSAKSGTVYWSLAEPSSPAWNPQGYWYPVPTGDVPVVKILGATVYQLPTHERYVYLFLKQRPGEAGGHTLTFLRIDAETQVWDGPRPLPLPDPAAKDFDAVLVSRAEIIPGAMPRTWNWSHAPQLAIRTADTLGNRAATWQERQLADAGDGWEQDGFGELLPGDYEIVALADQGNNGLYYVAILSQTTLLGGHLAARSWPPRQLTTGTRYSLGGGGFVFDEEFRGTLTLIAPNPEGTFATNELYVLTRNAGGQAMARILRPGLPGVMPTIGSSVPASVRILPNSGLPFGDKFGLQCWIAFTDDSQPDQAFYGRVFRQGPGEPIFLDTPVPARPVFNAPFDFAAPQGAAALQARRQVLAAVDQANTTVPNRGYVKEATYLVPLAIAQALARSGEHRAALDWFRICYDYTASEADRKIAPLLREEEKLADSLPWHADGWLADPMAPHRIAATRRNCYTRYTVTAIAQCLCDLANAEFTRDNAESLPRARTAYLDCLTTLAMAGLDGGQDNCGEVIARLRVDGDAPPAVVRAVELLRAEAGGIPDPAVLAAGVAAAGQALNGGKAPWGERLSRARDVIAVARARSTAPPRLQDVIGAGRADLAARRSSALRLEGVEPALEHVARGAQASFDHTLYTITRVPVRRLADPATRLPWLRGIEAEPAADDREGTEAATPHAARGEGAAAPGPATSRPAQPVLPPISGESPPPDGEVLGSPASAGLASMSAADPALALRMLTREAFVPEAPVSFCVPPNPAVEALRISAQLGLHKLRSCRNIAGMQRPVEPYAAPTDAVSGMPVAVGGTVLVPGLSAARQPTQYRYAALIRRARELTAMASQMESGMLRAMESAETEKFARFKAEQELTLAVANVQVHEARITEAGHDITLAQMQQRRAQIQAQTYQQWLDDGLNQWEDATLSSYYAEGSAQSIAALMKGQIQAMEMFLQATSSNTFMTAAAFTLATVTALATVGQSLAEVAAIQARTSGQVNSFLASIERRKDQWQLEKALADQDIAIGGEQLSRAQDHLQVVRTEKSVAQTAADQARDTLEFLKGEFLDAALYDWMSGQLESAYRFFLQQATAVARLAQQQLAFERQEEPPVRLREDYWSPPPEPQAGAAADRRGLTGAARLGEDLQRLDDHAFATDRRRLQIRKSMSLATLYPMEFQRFRESGVFLFPTPMELFDRDFPGHYMRLVRQVRTSVIALTPPTEGIRATLSSLGLSRVVIGPETGQETVLQRAPESVALSSGFEATGTIDLEPEKGELLLPFEGIGVDTRWELRMPKPANPFNYDTITDVLFTVDYTALDSSDYRHQVIRSLPRQSWDRAFSLRGMDCWYDLHNPDQVPPEDRMVARFRTQRGSFRPNLDELNIDHVVLYVVRAPGLTKEVPVKSIRLTSADGQTTVGGAATTLDGVISTRRGTWPELAHVSPVGEWELVLPDTEQVIRWFREELIEDILLVVTHSGREPDWPE
jgi:hypothetical protein